MGSEVSCCGRYIKATIFALELGMLEQRTQILGGVALFDLEDLSTYHAWQITPSVASKVVKLLVVRINYIMFKKLKINNIIYLTKL